MYFGGGRSILGVGKCWTYRSLGDRTAAGRKLWGTRTLKPGLLCSKTKETVEFWNIQKKWQRQRPSLQYGSGYFCENNTRERVIRTRPLNWRVVGGGFVYFTSQVSTVRKKLLYQIYLNHQTWTKKGGWTLFLIMKHPIQLIKARIDTCTQLGARNSPRTRIKSKNKLWQHVKCEMIGNRLLHSGWSRENLGCASIFFWSQSPVLGEVF